MANLLQSLHLAPVISKQKIVYNGRCSGSVYPFGLTGATTLRLPSGDITVSALWANMGITVGRSEVLEGNVKITMPSFILNPSTHISQAEIPIRAIISNGQVHYYEPILQISVARGFPQLSTTLDSVVADSILILPEGSSITGDLSVRNSDVGQPVDMEYISVNPIAFDWTIQDLYEGKVHKEEPDVEWTFRAGWTISLGIQSNPRRQMKGQKAETEISIKPASFSWKTRVPELARSEIVSTVGDAVILLTISYTENGFSDDPEIQRFLSFTHILNKVVIYDSNYPEEKLVHAIVSIQPYGLQRDSFVLPQFIITHVSISRDLSLDVYNVASMPSQDMRPPIHALMLKNPDDDDIIYTSIDASENMGSSSTVPNVVGDINSRCRLSVLYALAAQQRSIIPNSDINEIVIYSTDIITTDFSVEAHFTSETSTPVVHSFITESVMGLPAIAASSFYSDVTQALTYHSCPQSKLLSYVNVGDHSDLALRAWLVVNAKLQYMIDPITVSIDSDPDTPDYKLDPVEVLVDPE